jgi:NAD(P)-dependent dehydrogenase (short-subunit alcohol dehydrogenase family)
VPSRKPALPPSTPLRPMPRALVVGASSGMGAALARRLAAEGYAVALVARRKRLLDALRAEIDKAAGEKRALAYVHDVRDYDAVPELLRRIVADLGGLDLVVYASGVNFPPGLHGYNFRGDRDMLEVNLIGAFAWLNPIAAMFESAHAGRIVGISSVAGDRGRVGNPGYNASKAGLTSYLESLHNRLTRHGVHVLTVKAGFVQTDMLKAAQKVMFPITAEKAAADIYGALRRRRQQIYTPWFWTWIMLVVRNIPSFVFRRMSF